MEAVPRTESGFGNRRLVSVLTSAFTFLTMVTDAPFISPHYPDPNTSAQQRASRRKPSRTSSDTLTWTTSTIEEVASGLRSSNVGQREEKGGEYSSSCSSRVSKLLSCSDLHSQIFPSSREKSSLDISIWNLHLHSSARIAVLFSGGIDCTYLTHLIHSFLPPSEPIDLLNVSFENPRAVESSRKLKEIERKKEEKVRNKVKGGLRREERIRLAKERVKQV